jgi:beta-glucosidase
MLRGFEKVRLEPMETRRISFVLEPHHLALLDANLKWVVEPGMFEVLVGSSSENIRLKASLEVTAVRL